MSEPRNPLFRGALIALKRAAEVARQTAIQTNTMLVMHQNGKLLRIPADKLREPETKESATIMTENQ